MTPFLEYLPEKNGVLGIDQVASKDLAKVFKPVRSPNHGFVDCPYWLRFSIENGEHNLLKRLLEIGFPFLDYITLYEPQADGSFIRHSTGRAMPFETRRIKHSLFLFNINILPGTHTYYVRIKTESAMYFPMILWEEHALWKADHESQFILGLYYGIMVVMALYNLFIFFSLRDRAYLFYVLYITCFILYQMTSNGLAYEYLWPKATWWNRHSTIFLAGTAMIWAIFFTKDFLSTPKVAPVLDRMMNIIAIFSGVLVVLSLMLSYGLMLKVTLAAVSVFVALMILTGVVCLMRGQRSARFYLMAWLAMLTGVMVLILWNVDLLPTGFFSIYSIQIGSVMDVVLLSLALADRINELRLAREEAMKEAMAQRVRAERQREAMVRELHDGIGAISTNISILAEKARLFGAPKEVDTDLATISDLARQGRMEIATFMDCLDEGDQEATAFIAELRFLANQILVSNGISFDFDPQNIKGDVLLSPFVRINIMKIFQEALTNIVKHSKATKTHVKISVDSSQLCLIIKDNGRGLYREQDRAGGGRGISNMKKRANSLGGHVIMVDEHGVKVRVEVPLVDKKVETHATRDS